MEMLFTGRWMEADEALHHGLVNAVLPADQLMDHARGIARQLADGPPLVFAAIKEVVREAEDKAFQDVMNRITKRQLETVDILYDSDDNLEGARAFSEKRSPVWKGK